MNQIVIQGIGFAAFVVMFLSFQTNKRNSIITIRSFSNFLYSIHFFLLGAMTASALHIVAVIRNVLFQNRTKYKLLDKIFWLITFLIIYIFIGLYTWGGLPSILSTLGLTLGTIAVWNKKTSGIRLFALIGTVSWFIHNILVLSYAGMITDFIMIISLTIAMFRFDKKKSFE